MAKFITADTHFGHSSILNSCENTRGHFKSVSQMNETIIQNWNNVVDGEDTIYHLGDIAVNISNQSLFEILKKLNGKIIFIKGNHDEQNRFNWLERHNYKYAKGMKFSFHEVGTIITENKKEYYLTHYPMDLGYQTEKRRNFHGHIHGHKIDKESCLNVGVDSPEIGERAFGEPIKWQEAVEILEEKVHLFKKMESMHYQVVWLDIENNIRKEHDHYHSIEAAYRSIEEWWQLHDYKPPYVRWIEKDTVTRIDYGSHTQFYEIIKITE